MTPGPVTDALFDVDRDVWQALSGSGLAQWRVDAVYDALRERARREDGLRTSIRALRTTVSDLQIHLRDRDAHIRNLEAELRPHLVAEQPETEAML